MSGEIDKQGKGGKKTKKSLDSLGQGYQRLAAAAGAYLTVATAIKALKIADDYAVLQRRIRTATRDTGDYVAVSKELYEIAQRNGTALKDTVDIFQRLSLQAKALGASNDEVLRLTDTVQKLGVIGGSSQAAMSAGLMQFSQAMASGTVRAEEINSIMENLPELAVRIEKGLKLLPGTLKQAVNEGKVLSKEVFQAVLQMAPQVAQEFAQIPDDLARSGQMLQTSVSKLLDSLNKSYDVTQSISTVFRAISLSLDKTVATKGGFFDFLNNVAGSRLEQLYGVESAATRTLKYGEQYNHLLAQRKTLEDEIARIVELNDPRDSVQLDAASRLLAQTQAELDRLKSAANKPQPLVSSSTSGTEPPADVVDPKVQKRVEQMVKSLQLQAATWGKTAQQVALYRIEMALGDKAATQFGQTVLANARAAAEFITMRQAQAEATERLTQAEVDFMDATIAYNQSQREMLDTVLDSVDPFRAYNKRLAELEQLAKQFPEHADKINQAIEQLNASLEEGPPAALAKSTDKMSEFAVQAARNIQSSFADFLFDPFSSGLDGMLVGFVRTLQRMAAEMLAQTLLMSAFKAMAGGSSTGFWASMAASIKHDGGIMGAGGPQRMVSPLLFAGAPRYHAGGIAGLKPLEMPAILQKGEEVLPRSDPRHAANGGGASQPFNVTIVDDRASVDKYMATPAAGQHFITHIKRNAQVIKGILG